MKGKFDIHRCLTKPVWYFVGFAAIFVGIIGAGTAFATLLSIVGTEILIVKSFLAKEKQALQLQDSLKEEISEEFLRNAFQDTLTKRLLAEELDKCLRENGKLASRTVLYRKVIYGAVTLALLAVILPTCYYRESAAPLVCLVALLFTWLWNKATPERMLLKKAKKNPKKAFAQLVQEDLYDTAANPIAKRCSRLGIILLVGVFVLFFGISAKTRMDFSPTDGGLMLTGYAPGILDMEEAVIPDHIDGQRVVAIADDVFSDIYHLEQVTIPASVRSIGVRAFKNCGNLEQITLPAELQSLGGEAFMNCTSLREIQIPEGVTELRGNTFEGCSDLESVELPEGMTAIHAYCFRGCTSLSAIQLPEHISEIRTYTFEGCSSLKSVTVPVGVTRIASHAFHNCTSLNYVYLPDTLEEIGNSAFRNCTALKSAKLPAGVDKADNAFKESPTKITEKRFTDEQWDRIVEDTLGKPFVMPMSYMYDPSKGADVICCYDTDGYAILIDPHEYEPTLEKNQALQSLETTAELIAWLEKAKAADVTTVQVKRYSELASQIAGEPIIISSEWNINKLLEQVKNGE